MRDAALARTDLLMSRDFSLTEKAYISLRQDLLACRLPPGEKLNIQELAQNRSVSLGAVREALSRLTSEGLVETQSHRGFRAAPISASDLLDLTRVRTSIEGLCLKRAIEIGDLDWEAAIVAAHHRLARMPKCADGDPNCLSDDYAAAHAAFHHALVAACDSMWLLRMRELLYAQSERYRYLAVSLAQRPRDVTREHEQIMQAVLNRDAEKAQQLLGRHFDTTTNLILEAKLVVDHVPAAPSAPLARRESDTGPATASVAAIPSARRRKIDSTN